VKKETKSYIDKPWGWEKLWAHTDQYVGKILHIKDGRQLSRQYHEKKEETIYVLSGTLILEIGRGQDMVTKRLERGDTYHIEPGVVHRFCAPKDRDPVRLMEVSTPELDDVVRLEDDYNRLDGAK
jgi:mannose-6-phosphate isomerase-like protein (cupin superfamily)